MIQSLSLSVRKSSVSVKLRDALAVGGLSNPFVMSLPQWQRRGPYASDSR